MKSKINALLFFFLFFTQCIAQQIHFEKSYFNTGYHYTCSFVELKDSGFLLVGYIGNGTGVPKDNFIMRLNQYGDTIFTKSFANSGYFTNALLYNDSVILAANGFPFINNYQINTIKINVNTADTFDFRYYGYYNQGYSGTISKCSDNGYIMINEVALDYGIIKLDSNENVQWHLSYNMSQGISDIAETPLGGYVACGSEGNWAQPYSVLYLDDSGNTIWTRNYGDNSALNYENTGNVRILPDSNFLVACTGPDWHLMKLNHINGDTIWTKITDSGIGIFYLNAYKNKTFLATGRTKIYLLDLNGDSIWARACPPFFRPLAIHPTSDGGFAYTAKYIPPPFAFEFIGFVKCDSLGNTVYTSIIENENGLQASFYPNPATSELYISTSTFASEKNLTITLTNMQGKQVLQLQYDKSKAVDVSCLPNGIYVAEVRGKDKVVRDKIVVQH